jgi:hypothetical protein
MYTIYLVWNGNKKQVADKYSYDSKREWEWDKEALPYDIIDEDDHNVWFDYGDM